MKARVFTIGLVLLLSACSGDIQFQPAAKSSVAEAAAKIEYPSSFEQKPAISPGEAEYDLPITSPSGAKAVKSALVYVSCYQTATDAAASGRRGFMLLPGSDLVLVRDQGDVEASQVTPSVSVSHCESKSPQEAQPVSTQIQNLNLSVGEDTEEVVITSPETASAVESSLLRVSCTNVPEKTVASGINGVILVPGSRIVLARDLDYKFPDGSTSAGGTPFVEVNCD